MSVDPAPHRNKMLTEPSRSSTVKLVSAAARSTPLQREEPMEATKELSDKSMKAFQRWEGPESLHQRVAQRSTSASSSSKAPPPSDVHDNPFLPKPAGSSIVGPHEEDKKDKN